MSLLNLQNLKMKKKPIYSIKIIQSIDIQFNELILKSINFKYENNKYYRIG